MRFMINPLLLGEVIFCAVLTGYVVLKCRKAFMFRQWEWAKLWLVASLFSAAFFGLILWAFLEEPDFMNTNNYGFGPGWKCTYPGKGDPICLRDTILNGKPQIAAKKQ